MAARKTILLISFDFPPQRASSGVQRVLAFTRYLPNWGWEPIVLTSKVSGYGRVDEGLEKMIPASLLVYREPAFDSSKVFSIAGRYPEWLTLPDKWNSWIPKAVLRGWRVLRKDPNAVIYSTYPYASSHLIAYLLKRLTHNTWVADFRDPMLQKHYPTTPLMRRSNKWLEESVFKYADQVVCTTDAAAAHYSDRYGGFLKRSIAVVGNGFEEFFFRRVEGHANVKRSCGQPIRIIHSGAVYKEIRDPGPFFQALRWLIDETGMEGELEVVFRGPGQDAFVRSRAYEYKLANMVRVEPPLAYEDALGEMLGADVLLVLQSSESNQQVPAKIYEYLRAGRVILCLSAGGGATTAALADAEGVHFANLADANDIKRALVELLKSDPRAGVKRSGLTRYSRETRTGELAELLVKLD